MENCFYCCYNLKKYISLNFFGKLPILSWVNIHKDSSTNIGYKILLCHCVSCGNACSSDLVEHLCRKCFDLTSLLKLILTRKDFCTTIFKGQRCSFHGNVLNIMQIKSYKNKFGQNVKESSKKRCEWVNIELLFFLLFLLFLFFDVNNEFVRTLDKDFLVKFFTLNNLVGRLHNCVHVHLVHGTHGQGRRKGKT